MERCIAACDTVMKYVRLFVASTSNRWMSCCVHYFCDLLPEPSIDGLDDCSVCLAKEVTQGIGIARQRLARSFYGWYDEFRNRQIVYGGAVRSE
jgi:hypothetical protein